MEPSVYEYPSIFRRVHMEKPGEIEEETDFLKQVWRRHLKKPVRRVLDVACGDSPHGLALARAGIEVAGIDRSPTMIAKGRKEAGAAPIRFYRRPIERFRIPERLFDTAFFMSETTSSGCSCSSSRASACAYDFVCSYVVFVFRGT